MKYSLNFVRGVTRGTKLAPVTKFNDRVNAVIDR